MAAPTTVVAGTDAARHGLPRERALTVPTCGARNIWPVSQLLTAQRLLADGWCPDHRQDYLICRVAVSK